MAIWHFSLALGAEYLSMVNNENNHCVNAVYCLNFDIVWIALK